MIKINNELERTLTKIDSEKLGSFFEGFGAFTDDKTEFILYYKGNDIYLAHISEFEQQGIFIRLKNEIK